MPDPVSDAVLTITNRHTGENLRLRRVREAGQTVLLIDGSLPPGTSGPPAHIHRNSREETVIKAGTLGARVGREQIVVPAGGSAVFPVGVVHAWWNAGNDVLQMNGRAIPADDLDVFLQAMFAVLNAGASGRPPLFYLAHVVWRHRHTQTLETPPPAIQRMLFGVVVFVGHILGKYRGSDWPGAPASCTGAPGP
jgi:quercetin dioxygenase-like cupin family protein